MIALNCDLTQPHVLPLPLCRQTSGAAAASGALSPTAAFALLVAARLISALVNIIHDCDETYNYLEPLHFVMYGSGMQTWEYGAQYALRAYIYLLLHAVPAAPALLLGAGRGKHVALCCAPGKGGYADPCMQRWHLLANTRMLRCLDQSVDLCGSSTCASAAWPLQASWWGSS